MKETTAPYSAGGQFVDADPAGGIPRGTTITAADLNAHQAEILQVITDAGLVPDAGDLTQLSAAVAALIAAAVPGVSGLMPKAGGTFTGDVFFNAIAKFLGAVQLAEVGALKLEDPTTDALWRTALAYVRASADLNFGAAEFNLNLLGLAARPKYNGADLAFLAEAGGVFEAQLLHVRDEKASGVHGGTFPIGTWEKRDLNTVLTNEIAGASLASSVITLPAGTYWIEASAPHYDTNGFVHKATLYNTADNGEEVVGTSMKGGAAVDATTFSWVSGRFIIGAEKTFELRHKATGASTSWGFGGACSFGIVEVYSDVKIWKVA